MFRRSGRLSGQDVVPFTSYSTNATPGPSRKQNQRNSTTDLSNGAVHDFEEWTLPRLQAEVKRYGFKVSRKRSTLIDQLKAVHDALQKSKAAFEIQAESLSDELDRSLLQSPQARTRKRLILPTTNGAEDSEARMGSTPKTKGKGKGKGRKSDPYVLDVSSDSSSDSVMLAEDAVAGEAGDFTAQLEAEALSATDGELSSDSLASRLPLSASVSPSKRPRGRPRSKSPASSSSSQDVPLAAQGRVRIEEEEEGEAVDPSPALSETMTTAIRGDPSVWGRILRYEPISFDEVISIATQNGLAMDTGKRKEELRTWLDRQCICFYSAELTGSRSRH